MIKNKTLELLPPNNRREITLYKYAEQYLKDVLQARFDPKKSPPVKKWKAEQAELLVQKSALNNDYKKLKAETHEVEIIRREVEQIVRAERPISMDRKKSELEL